MQGSIKHWKDAVIEVGCRPVWWIAGGIVLLSIVSSRSAGYLVSGLVAPVLCILILAVGGLVAKKSDKGASHRRLMVVGVFLIAFTAFFVVGYLPSFAEWIVQKTGGDSDLTVVFFTAVIACGLSTLAWLVNLDGSEGNWKETTITLASGTVGLIPTVLAGNDWPLTAVAVLFPVFVVSVRHVRAAQQSDGR